MPRIFLIAVAVILFGWGAVYAQPPSSLENKWVLVVNYQPDTVDVAANISYEKQHPDSVRVRREIGRILRQLHENGYLAASVKKISYQTDTVFTVVHTGKQYKWLNLNPGKVPTTILYESGFTPGYFTDRPVYYKQVRQIQEKMLQYAENHGYPFAEVRLDSITFQDNKLAAQLKFKKNSFVQIDSIALPGTAPVKRSYIYNYLGLHPGDPYNESRIKSIVPRMEKLSFLELTNAPAVQFYDQGALIKLPLQKNQSNKLDGFIGVLPGEENEKVKIIGEFDLKLLNAFGTAKLLTLNYQGLQNNTQDLNTHFRWPYFMNTPVGLNADFDLYKKDSTYIDVGYETGIQYHWIGGDFLEVYVRRENSSLLNIDTQQVKNTRQLPENIDVKTTTYGLATEIENLDRTINPTRGYTLKVKAGVGTKEIERNQQIINLNSRHSDFEYRSLYDSIEMKTTQYNLSYNINTYWSLTPRHVIKVAAQGAGIWTDQLFKNELYRIGGMKVLRGFNEESIYASLYNVLTLEYHYLIQRKAYFYLFADGAYYQNRFQGFFEDTPIGFGTGITFETGAGIFTLNYALGRQKNNPVNFRSGKVHFGYINYF